MEYMRNVVVERRAAAVGLNGPFDLPVNPISYLVLHIDGLVGALTAPGQAVVQTNIENVTVSFKGSSILSISGADLIALLLSQGWKLPYVVNGSSTTNGDLARVSVPIPLSRRAFWSSEGFPASRRGELTISVTFTAEGTTFTGRQFSIESIELFGAEPKRFLKAVAVKRALSAGDSDLALPVGNPYAGILIFNPTLADAGFGTGNISSVKLLVDNVEHTVASSRFEPLREMFERRASNVDMYTAAALPDVLKYALIDLDPLQDGSYLLETDGRASVVLRFIMDSSATVRAIPIELVRLGEETTAAA